MRDEADDQSIPSDQGDGLAVLGVRDDDGFGLGSRGEQGRAEQGRAEQQDEGTTFMGLF